MGNLNEEDERANNLALTLEHPVLMIKASRDIVATAAMMERGIRQFANDVRLKELDTGHWVQLEAREEINKHLEEFFSELDEV
jgi:soluble epoxide hydrolase/lipid-phosphate phosphatase